MKTKPDLTNGYYAVRGSRDFYKGTSFRCNVWSENTHYFHDENYVDFVVYDGTLLMCMRNHISSEDNQPILKREGTVAVGLERNPLWEFVIGGVYSNGSISGDQIKLKIDGETLYMSYNGGVTWMKVGSVGSPAVELPKYTASVASVSSGTTADASVNVVNNDFKFTFSLPRGADGKDGTPGIPGESEFKSFIFTRSETQPARPDDDQGSYSDPVPKITDSNGVRIWHDTIPDGWLPVWVSTRDFNINGPKSSWSTPRRMVDTSDFIVVYGDANVTKIDITQPEYSLNKFYEGDANQAEAKWLEDINTKLGYTGWRDTAEESTGAVYMASCKLSGGVWSLWSINKIKGEKGDNGGYDYVFKLTEENTAPNPPKTSQDDYYQLEDEWYQYPQTVTEIMEYQWVSTRHKVNNEWSPYSPPVLYNSYATEGIAPSVTFKSFAFCRTNNVWSATDSKPTGGTYDKPWPTSGKIGGVTVKWSDTIPAGNGAIWMTTAIFDSKEHAENTHKSPEWSEPIQWSDTANLQIEYSAKTTYTKLENLQKYYDADPNGFEEAWRKDHPDWSDEGTNAIWMAVATMSNGIWSDWTVHKIKGENGTDGTSFNLIGNYKIYEDLIESEYNNPHVLGDAYTVNFINVDENENFIKPEYNEINDKIQWVDSTKTDSSKSGINNVLFIYDGDTWEYCGKFGGSEFIHIKYAEVVESGGFEVTIDGAKKRLQFTGSEGETPGDYIGIYTDNNSEDPTDGSLYKWSKWTGNDGWGYQYIYKLSKTNKPFEKDENGRPLLPTGGPSGMDQGIPYGWSDDPIDVTEDLPYCWMCYSQSDENGGWSDWKGTYEDKPALWAKWGVDGAPGESGAGYQQCFHLSAVDTEVFAESGIKARPDGELLNNWTTSAQGVNSSNPVEWRCDRVKEAGADTWSDWSKPHVFSHFGKNGEDGAGLEYVFLLVDNNVPKEVINAITDIPINSDGYQNDDYEPEVKHTFNTKDYVCQWTDNQSTVTAEKPFLYSSIRRKKNGQWQAFEEPVLWNQYVTNGLDGQMSLSIKVWRRSVTTSAEFDKPSGATFDLLANTLTFDENNGWTFNDISERTNNSVLWSCIAYVTGTVTNNEIYISANDWHGPNIESVDGRDGSGQSAVYLTVDPDYVLVNVDDFGKARFNQTITGYANYYYGSEVQSAVLTFASANDAITVTSPNVQEDGTSSSFKITIPEGTSINDHEYITIRSTPKDTSKTINGETIVFSELQSIISINKIASNDAYSLIVTPNQIVVPSNNKSWGTTITCTALKNGSVDSNATIKSLNDKVTLNEIGSGTYACQINNNTFDDLPSELTFVLEIDGKSIAHQTVSLIKQYVVSFTSFVFKWFSPDDDIEKPTGGSFYNPTPNEEDWKDIPPVKDSDNTLYMSWCKFSSDQPNAVANWSEPVIAQDTDLIDFKYSTLTTNPGDPDNNPNNWNELPDNAVWMAISKKLLGKWQPWEIFRIKGEKGDPGASITEVHEYYAWTATTNTPNITESDITTNPWNDITINNVTWTYAKPATFDSTKPYLWNIEVIVIEGINDGGHTITDYKITKPALISASGKGIAKIEEMYLLSKNASGVTNSGTVWAIYDETKHIPTEDYPYLWNYEKITYTDGSEESTPAVIIAVWNKGDKGDDGRSIGEIFEYYLYTDSETVPKLDWSEFQLSWNENGIEVMGDLKTDDTYWTRNALPPIVKNCLWNVEVIAYKDEGDGYTNTSCILLSNKANEINSIEECYMISTHESGVTITSKDVELNYPSSFKEDVWYLVANNQKAPVPTYNAPYLWNAEKITYNSGEYEFKSPTRIGALIKGDSGDPLFSLSVELSEDMYSVLLDRDTRCPDKEYSFTQEVELFENGKPVSNPTVEWKMLDALRDHITIEDLLLDSDTRKKYKITIKNSCKFDQNSLTLSCICKTSSGLQASKNCTIIALLETNRYSLHCTPARLIKKYNDKFVGDDKIQCAVYDDFTGTPVEGGIPSGYSLLYTYDDENYQTVTNGTITADAQYNWCKVYLVRDNEETGEEIKFDAGLIRDYVLVEISTLPKPEINYTVTPNEIVYDVQGSGIVGQQQFNLNHTFLYDGTIVKPSSVKIGYYAKNESEDEVFTEDSKLSVSDFSAYEFTLKIVQRINQNSYFVQATYEKDGDTFVGVYPIQIKEHAINFVVHAFFDTVNLGIRIPRPKGITSETRSVSLGTIGIEAYYDDKRVDNYTLEYPDDDGYVQVANTGAAYSTPKLYYEQYYSDVIGDRIDLLQAYLNGSKDEINLKATYQNASAQIPLYLTSQENNSLYHWVGVSSIGYDKQNYNIVGYLEEIGGDEFITEDDLENLKLSVKFFIDGTEVAADKNINLKTLASTGYDGKQLGVLKEFSIRVYDESDSIVFVENITRLDTPSDPFEAVPPTICVDDDWSIDLADKILIDGSKRLVKYYLNDIVQDRTIEPDSIRITTGASSGGDVITLKAEILESDESAKVIYTYTKQISTYANGTPGVGIKSITSGEDGSIDITTTDGNTESIAIPTQNSITLYYRGNVVNANKPTLYGVIWEDNQWTIDSADNFDGWSWDIPDKKNNGDRCYSITYTWTGVATSSITIEATDWQSPQLVSEGYPMIYPAGEWSSATNYIVTGSTAPYVKYNNNFYVAIESNKGVTPDKSDAWTALDKFNAIYTDIIFAGKGQVGAVLFNGDWMYSQEGTNVDDFHGEYKSISEIIGGKSQPNFAINCLTGEGYFSQGAFRWNGAGNIMTTGNMKALNKAILDSWTTQVPEQQYEYTYTVYDLTNLIVYNRLSTGETTETVIAIIPANLDSLFDVGKSYSCTAYFHSGLDIYPTPVWMTTEQSIGSSLHEIVFTREEGTTSIDLGNKTFEYLNGTIAIY